MWMGGTGQAEPALRSILSLVVLSGVESRLVVRDSDSGARHPHCHPDEGRISFRRSARFWHDRAALKCPRYGTEVPLGLRISTCGIHGTFHRPETHVLTPKN